MTRDTPPDSWFEPPGISMGDAYEDAVRDADSVTAEWSEFAELEVFIVTALQSGGEPLFTLDSISRDGILLEQVGLEFEDIDALRDWLRTHGYPLPTE